MFWDIKKNTIAKLFVGEENLIHPWGIETADSSAFFSLEEGVGYRYVVLSQQVQATKTTFHVKQHISMREGSFVLSVDDAIIDDRTIERKAELVVLEPTFLMDYVMRFRLLKKYFSHATIAGHTLPHRNTNLYYQYPVKQASLFGKNYRVNVQVQEALVPQKMAPFLYVRDREDEWIIHARMLPHTWDKEVIKLCNPWAKTRPLPQILSRPITAIAPLKEALWYRGERDPYKGKILKRVNPQAFPMVKLEKGEVLKWHVVMEINA